MTDLSSGICRCVEPNAIRAERSEQDTDGGTSRIQNMFARLKSYQVLFSRLVETC